MTRNEAEVLVVGGGPAGLSAALYLARYDRTVALFDAGQGRSTWAQITHNYLGFPGGIPARRLRDLGRQQLAEYRQVTCVDTEVRAVRSESDRFVATGEFGEWIGRAVIFCTGVLDHYPEFSGWEEYVGRSLYWCITCDGYTCRDKRVVVVGNTNAAATETLQLGRFTSQLTLLTDTDECWIDERFRQRLAAAGIPLLVGRIQSAEGERGYFRRLRLVDGRAIGLDELFSIREATPRSGLALDLGVEISELGYLTVDTEQKTNVPGVFAAGDVTRLHSHQVTTAVHEGGQAASAANYYLYPPELKDE